MRRAILEEMMSAQITPDDFEILKAKEIVDILIGDTPIEGHGEADIRMPYLSCGDIRSLSTLFGYDQKYKKMYSRYQYMQDAMVFCIRHSKIQDLLNILFSKEKFQGKDYNKICDIVIGKINKCLICNDRKMEKIGEFFRIIPITPQVSIEIPPSDGNIIDRDLVREFYKKATNDINEGNLDSAITKCRTIIEEVFCFAIEKKGQVPLASGNISDLCNQFKGLYDMHNDKNLDKRINKLLSGVNSIISAVVEMRNENSDAHGKGSGRIRVEKHHAVFALNVTASLAGFLLDVVDRKLS